MTHPALIERITRSLAYMLRHQPEKFDVEVDAHGFADIDEVIRALNERLGESVMRADVETAVGAGDRVRYEVEGDTIRALYGHSIPVEPGESSKPQELLYLAVPARDVDRAQRFGLRGGRRRFVHLALSESDARDTGRRASRDYTVLTIRALDAWEEGINFYDRRSLFLAEEVPTHLIEVGETYDDGDPPQPRGYRDDRSDRSPRRGGRGRRDERPERGDRDRDRDRERDPERRSEEVEIRAAAPSPSGSNGRGGRGRGDDRGAPRRPRRGAERSDREDRGRGGRRDDRGERRSPATAPAADAAQGDAAVLTDKRQSAPVANFGAGLFEAPAPEPASEPENVREPAPEPEPERVPAPAPEPEPEPEPGDTKADAGGFGAGL